MLRSVTLRLPSCAHAYIYMEAGTPTYFRPLSSVLKLTLEHASELPGGLVKTQMAGPHPDCLIKYDWGGAQEFAFLTSSQVMQRFQGPQFENQGFRT